MAFPAVQTADTKNGVVTSNTQIWTLTYPTNLVGGDIILACAGVDGVLSAVKPTGWDSQVGAQSGVACGAIVAAKRAAGTETGTFSWDMGASEQGGWRVFRITGVDGAGLHATLQAGPIDTASTSGASQFPDPASLDPTDWGSEETLWVAVIGVDTSRTISVYPLANLNTADVSGGSTGATLGVCMANSAVASLDPGQFTISASDDWAAITIAIRPAAVTIRNINPNFVYLRKNK
jgi:hypothetical protein